MLLPMIGIIQAGGIAHAERYTYIPLIGIAIMIVWGSADFLRTRRVPHFAVRSGVALILMVLMMVSFQQTAYWKDTVTLWTHELKYFPQSDRAHNSLGNGLLDQGNSEGAIREFRLSLLLNPDSTYAHASLGYALYLHGEFDEAMAEDREAIRLDPTCYTARNNLGNVLAQEGKNGEAAVQYRAALKIRPTDSSIHFNLGNLLMKMGNCDEALEEFREAVNVNPSHFKARYQLGKNLYTQGNRSDGMMELQKALLIEPSNKGIQNDLAWMLATAPEETLRNASRSLELALSVVNASGGKDPLFLDTLAAAYAENGNFIEALRVSRRALELAESENNRELMKSLREEITLYKSGKSVRDPR